MFFLLLFLTCITASPLWAFNPCGNSGRYPPPYPKNPQNEDAKWYDEADQKAFIEAMKAAPPEVALQIFATDAKRWVAMTALFDKHLDLFEQSLNRLTSDQQKKLLTTGNNFLRIGEAFQCFYDISLTTEDDELDETQEDPNPIKIIENLNGFQNVVCNFFQENISTLHTPNNEIYLAFAAAMRDSFREKRALLPQILPQILPQQTSAPSPSNQTMQQPFQCSMPTPRTNQQNKKMYDELTERTESAQTILNKVGPSIMKKLQEENKKLQSEIESLEKEYKKKKNRAETLKKMNDLLKKKEIPDTKNLPPPADPQ